MTKTPQQLAKEYGDYFMPGEDNRAYTSVIKEIAFLAGYQAAKDQLADAGKVMNPSNNSNGWISVKEQLPEDYVGWTTVYGCILSRWGVQPGFYTKDSGIWISRFVEEDEGSQNYVKFESVTHWMPLPEPPGKV